MEVRKSVERGHVSHDWLESFHTFSFGSYYDPQHMRFRVLRVMNEDWIDPGRGFGTHPHDNMEILTYVISGELEHKDSMGTGSVIKAGEFQLMAAGSGITHSEFNPSNDNKTHLYQIWLLPDSKDVTPSYQQKDFSTVDKDQSLQLIASKTAEHGSLSINQDVKIYKGDFATDKVISLPISPERYGWLQVVKGELQVGKDLYTAGDGISFSGTLDSNISTGSEVEFLFFDLP